MHISSVVSSPHETAFAVGLSYQAVALMREPIGIVTGCLNMYEPCQLKSQSSMLMRHCVVFDPRCVVSTCILRPSRCMCGATNHTFSATGVSSGNDAFTS